MSYPAITVTVNVAAIAGSPQVNQASVSGGGSASSTAMDSTTIVPIAAPLPPPPVLTLPTNGASGVSRTSTLSWNASAGATSYEVYFGTSSPPPFLANTTATTYSPGALAGGATHYWDIAAGNASGTAASATWSFTTQTGVAPLQFYPLTPCRIADTRTAQGFMGAFGPVSYTHLDVYKRQGQASALPI